MIASNSADTNFAPAARLSLVEIKRQTSLLRDFPLLDPVLNALPLAVLILNEQRQIVHANQKFDAFIPLGQDTPLLGKRPGEALDCIHAGEMPAGCGTSLFCRTCGALSAVLGAQKGQDTIRESRMTVIREGKPVAIDLRLWARPFNFGGQHFCLVSTVDISDEKRRLQLERIFFHDIANTAAVIAGYADLMGTPVRYTTQELTQMAGYMADAGHQMVDEIAAQRQLLAAERGDLQVEPRLVDTTSVLTSIINLYRRHPLAEERYLRLDLNTESVTLWTDGALLGRVINNMVKNALEATDPGQTITLGCNQVDGGARFWVHNPGHISPQTQIQLFQRSFSTKGKNRGLGTYGMKLLSEGYLHGTVSFTSSAAVGTTFSVTLPLDWTDQAREAAHVN
jgi:nitrogen-specific signal transduction histidine kinase